MTVMIDMFSLDALLIEFPISVNISPHCRSMRVLIGLDCPPAVFLTQSLTLPALVVKLVHIKRCK